MAEIAASCARCGTRREEWDDNPDAYVAEADRCPGCERIEWEAESWRQDGGNLKGLSIRLVRPDKAFRPTIPPGSGNDN